MRVGRGGQEGSTEAILFNTRSLSTIFLYVYVCTHFVLYMHIIKIMTATHFQNKDSYAHVQNKDSYHKCRLWCEIQKMEGKQSTISLNAVKYNVKGDKTCCQLTGGPYGGMG